MDLQQAALALILGSAYTVSHKAMFGLSPALRYSRPASAVATGLWLAVGGSAAQVEP